MGHRQGKGELTLVRDLPSFTDIYIVPYLTARKDFALLIQGGKVSGLDLAEVTEEKLDTLVEALHEDPAVMIVDPGVYEPEVDVIEDVGDFTVEQASEISKNVLLVVYELSGSVAFTYFLPRDEYYSMSEEEQSEVAILDAAQQLFLLQMFCFACQRECLSHAFWVRRDGLAFYKSEFGLSAGGVILARNRNLLSSVNDSFLRHTLHSMQDLARSQAREI